MSSSNGFTLSDLYALEKALAEGARRVKYSDKEVEFRSLDEMLKLRDLIKSELGMGTSCGKIGLFGGRRIIAKHSKGLGPGSEENEGC